MGRLWGTSARIATLAAGIAMAVSVTGPAAAAPAAQTLAWSAQLIDHQPPFAKPAALGAVSCPSVSFCAAVSEGHVLVSTDPRGGPASWTVVGVAGSAQGAGGVASISCPSQALCVAGGPAGLFASTEPLGPAAGWRQVVPAPRPGDLSITGVSCASAHLCVATEADPYTRYARARGTLLVSSDPTGGPGAWTPATVDRPGVGFTAVACPSASLCVAGDQSGDVATSSSPAGGPSAWTLTSVEHQPTFALHGITGISCPAATMCAAVDASGSILSSTAPTGGTPAWSLITRVDPVGGAQDISCASPDLCVAVGGKDAVISSEPTGGPAAWHALAIDVPTGSSPAETFNFGGLLGVSCPATSLCVATDSDGRVVSSAAPLGAADSWTARQVDGVNSLTSLSCPSAALCVAVDDAGHALTTTDPRAGPAGWNVGAVDSGHKLLAVSCPSPALCVASDDGGDVLASARPLDPASWTVTNIDGHFSLSGLACPSSALCVAVDNNGRALTANDPAGGAGAWRATPVIVPGMQEPAPTGGPASRGYFYNVSCATVHLCLATAYTGLEMSTDPTGGTPAWHALGDRHIANPSCALPTTCFADSDRGLVASKVGATLHWDPVGAELGTSCAPDLGSGNACLAPPSVLSTGGEGAAQSVSCPSPGFCAGINGRGFASTSDTAGHVGDWTATDVGDRAGPFPISCPSIRLCVAVDQAGQALVGTPARASASRYVGSASINRVRLSARSVRAVVRCRGASGSSCRVRLVATGRLRGKAIKLGAVVIELTGDHARHVSVRIPPRLRAHRPRHVRVTFEQRWLGGFKLYGAARR